MTDEPFVRINEQGPANFNWADPSEEYVITDVRIPTYDVDVSIGYDAPRIGFDDLSWPRALDELCAVDPRSRRGRKAQQTLSGVLSLHRDEIQQKWEDHRAEEIEAEIEDLEAEREELR